MEMFVARLTIARYQMEDIIDILLNNGYYVKLHKDFVESDKMERVQVYIYEDLSRINKEIKEKTEE